MTPRRHQIQKNATLTVTGNSGALPNLGRGLNPTIVAMLDITGAVTGTSPSITVNILGSLDGTRFDTIASFTAQTAALTGPVRLVVPNVLEPFVEVSWTITGTTPSFGGVNIDLLFVSPDA